MGLFKRKPRVSLDAFCRDFYDHQLLHAQIVGIDAASIFFEMVRQSVIEADASFASVDPQLFASEMTILRFEVFGIAWLHEVGDKHAAAQSEFTKQYLEEHGESRIWDSIEPYNQAVARSSTLGQKPDTPSGRAYLVFVDSIRMQLFEKWHKQG